MLVLAWRAERDGTVCFLSRALVYGTKGTGGNVWRGVGGQIIVFSFV